jgi:hypothetical protein
MKQRTERDYKRVIANAFGSFGYLFCFLLWLWVSMLYLNIIKSATSFVSPQNSQTNVIYAPTVTILEPIGMIILAVIVVLMVGVTIYALVMVPKSIVKTSNKIVHKAAEAVAPVVIKAQHKQDTKGLRIKITARAVIGMKLSLILIPLLLTATSNLLEEQSISYQIALIVGCGLALLSAMSFGIQYILATFLRIKLSYLW